MREAAKAERIHKSGNREREYEQREPIRELPAKPASCDWSAMRPRVHHLSHGDQRKLELAMILAPDPEMLLLDEPTAGMGAEDVPAFIELIQSMTNRACRALSNKDYELVRDSLLKLIIDVSLGDESTDRGEGLSIFRRIMERAPEPAPDLVVEKIDNGSPLEWHDEVWIKRDVIADFVAKQMGRRVPDSTLNRLMIAAGSREHLIAARKEQSGKQTTRKLWLIPKEAME